MARKSRMYKYTKPANVQWWEEHEGPEAQALCDYQLAMFHRVLNNPDRDTFIHRYEDNGNVLYFGHITDIEIDDIIQTNFQTDEKLLLIKSWVNEYINLHGIKEEIYEDDVLVGSNF